MPPALVSVFAVEDTALQVVWRALPAPDVCIEVGDHQVAAAATPPAFLRVDGRPPRPLAKQRDAFGGPGAITIDGLEPATTYDVVLSGPRLAPRLVERVTTLPAPPGRLLRSGRDTDTVTP